MCTGSYPNFLQAGSLSIHCSSNSHIHASPVCPFLLLFMPVNKSSILFIPQPFFYQILYLMLFPLVVILAFQIEEKYDHWFNTKPNFLTLHWYYITGSQAHRKWGIINMFQDRYLLFLPKKSHHGGEKIMLWVCLPPAVLLYQTWND